MAALRLWATGVAALLVVGATPIGSAAQLRADVRVLSARSVTLVSPSQTLSAADVSIRDADGRTLHPAKVGRDRQVTGFSDDDTPVLETRLHVLLDEPLPEGMPVTVDTGAWKTHVVYSDEQVSTAIQVNQVGYATHGPKYAYVGEWLGTAGPMPVDSRQFRLEDLSGRVVFVGELSPRAASDPWSGNDVYDADFTRFAIPGQYRVVVPGVGSSYEFKIGNRVYDRVYLAVARLMYHARNGTPIVRPYADPGYERPGGIPASLDGVLHPRVFNSPHGPGSTPGGARAIRRGWFDAGDYGQYVTNAAPVWFAIGAAMDLAPGNFLDGDLGIPESGNGIPDLIDELEWGMDWALTMQDDDGGVFWRIASRTWDSTLPQQVKEPRLIAERTTHATAAFAASAAIHARLLQPHRPARSDRVLAAARRAWRFAATQVQWPPEGQTFENPDDIHAGEYRDTSAVDALAWAAAELFRTTGERTYLAAFESRFRTLPLDPTAPVSFRDQGMAAAWAYLMSDSPSRDPELVERAQRAVIGGADWRLRQMAAHPFRAPQHPAVRLTGWGSFAHSTRGTLPLMQAWRLSGDDRYRHAAWGTPGPQLGANPQSMSYITGLGKERPQKPLSKLSQYDDVQEPLRGIPVNGPHYHLPAIWNSTRAVMAGYYPTVDTVAANLKDGYPALRRYTDSHLLPPMSEPTISEIALTAVAYGLLRDEGPGSGQASRAR